MSSGVLSVDVAPQPDGSWVVTSVAAAADSGQHAPRAAASVRAFNLHDVFLPIRTSLERSSEADSQLQAFIRTLPSPAPPRQQREGEIVADVTAAIGGGGGAGGGSGNGSAGSDRYGGDTGTATTAGNVDDDDETEAPPDGEDSEGVAARVTMVEETADDDRRVGQEGEDAGEGSGREGHFDSCVASPPPLRDLPPHLQNNLNTELQPGFGFGFRGGGGGGGGATCMIPETEFSPQESYDHDENVGRGSGIVRGLPWTSLGVGSLPVTMDDNDDDNDEKALQKPPPQPRQGDGVDAPATVPSSLAAAGIEAATGTEAAVTDVDIANGGRRSINTPLFGDESECHGVEGAATVTETNERDGERDGGGGGGGGGGVGDGGGDGSAGAGGDGPDQTSPVMFVPETEGLDHLGFVEDAGNNAGNVGGVGGFEDVAGVSECATAPPGSAWKTPAPRPRHGDSVYRYTLVSGAEAEAAGVFGGGVGAGVGGVVCTDGNPFHAPVSSLPPHMRGTAAGGSAGWNAPGGGGPGAARGWPSVRHWVALFTLPIPPFKILH